MNLKSAKCASILRNQILAVMGILFLGVNGIQAEETSASQSAPELFARTFKVDPRVFISISNLQTYAVMQSKTKMVSPGMEPFVSAMARDYFGQLGVDWESPVGKSIFFNDRLGKLFVKATQSDLDKIEKALSKRQSSLPQIHIKTLFARVPKIEYGTLHLGGTITNAIVSLRVSSWQSVGNITNADTTTSTPPGWMSILTPEKFKEAIDTLQSDKDIEYLAEPEVTTFSGRQTQMRATEIRNLDPDYGKGLAISGPASLEPPSDLVETGPILEVVPSVLSDGYAMNLGATIAVIELIGSIRSTNTLLSNTNARVRTDTPKFVVKLRGWQVAADLNMWDGQTVVIGGLPVANPVSTGKPLEESKIDREMVVFVTVTIVDPAGNRIHPDDEMPVGQKEIPPQPPQPM